MKIIHVWGETFWLFKKSATWEYNLHGMLGLDYVSLKNQVEMFGLVMFMNSKSDAVRNITVQAEENRGPIRKQR